MDNVVGIAPFSAGIDESLLKAACELSLGSCTGRGLNAKIGILQEHSFCNLALELLLLFQRVCKNSTDQCKLMINFTETQQLPHRAEER